ncbi:hypothetical protein N431DRAFT_499863 [Stipitochalara longipes BDJ]|nr:hypothetical protein N431DRAFT_499863 [Stipitochalara longipes BDJ]
MNKSTTLSRLLLAPPVIRHSLLSLRRRPIYPSVNRQYATAPNIAQTSFWLSLIPKPLRQASPRAALQKKVRSKEWNPATFFIVIFLLIGSMSIQMIALRNEFAAFSRRADAKIGLLKEIIERIQNGEEVDVEGLLGTGDKEREKEWEEVLQQIEREDQVWEHSRRTKPKHEDGNIGKEPPTQIHTEVDSASKTVPRTNAPSGFF